MPADRLAPAPPPAPRNSLDVYRICVVCLGNICRSPMAEVLIKAELSAASVLRASGTTPVSRASGTAPVSRASGTTGAGLAGRVVVESAGTGDWHLGGPMDRRARAELTRRGYDGSGHRARQIEPGWLDRFDLLVAMDASNMRALERMARGRPELAGRIRLLRSFDPDAPSDAQVPDPYGGSPADFAAVLDLIRAAARGLVDGLAKLLAEPAGA